MCRAWASRSAKSDQNCLTPVCAARIPRRTKSTAAPAERVGGREVGLSPSALRSNGEPGGAVGGPAMGVGRKKKADSRCSCWQKLSQDGQAAYIERSRGSNVEWRRDWSSEGKQSGNRQFASRRGEIGRCPGRRDVKLRLTFASRAGTHAALRDGRLFECLLAERGIRC
jgi:hypothetical protein